MACENADCAVSVGTDGSRFSGDSGEELSNGREGEPREAYVLAQGHTGVFGQHWLTFYFRGLLSSVLCTLLPPSSATLPLQPLSLRATDPTPTSPALILPFFPKVQHL